MEYPFCSISKRYILVSFIFLPLFTFNAMNSKLTLVLTDILDEWTNFYERVLDPKLKYSDKDKMELIRHWVWADITRNRLKEIPSLSLPFFFVYFMDPKLDTCYVYKS